METTILKQELLDLETEYWQAMKDNDIDTALRLSDERCLVAGAEGLANLDKPTLTKMFKEGTWRLQTFAFDKNVELQELGKDVAVLAYKVHSTFLFEGEEVTLDAADTSTWVRRKGQWVCAAHTETPIGDLFGRKAKRRGD